MKLKDLALSRYRFCARKTLKNNEDFLWEKFSRLLREKVNSIGGSENTLQKKIERKSPQSGYFVPLINSKDSSNEESGVVFYQGFYRTLISGIFLDVYILQEWIGLSKQFTTVSQLSKTADKLDPQFNSETKIESELPAECFCYFSEFPEAGLIDRKIFFTLLKTENFFAVELDYAHFAVSFAGERATAVIISKNFAAPEAKQNATKLFDELLREYFLSFAKVIFETNNIKALNAQSARQILLEYLDWYKANPPRSLREIEEANRDLTRYRVDLAEGVKSTEVHLHTMEINIGNAERVLDNPLLRPKKEVLGEILIKPLKLQAEQIRVDLTYLDIYEEKAKIVGEEIANLSNLQAGIWGRKMTWLFGLLSLLGAFQLFSDFQNWSNLWAKTAILATIIFIPILIIFGRDIKNRFINSSKEKFQPTVNKQLSPNIKKTLPPPAQIEPVQKIKKKVIKNK